MRRRSCRWPGVPTGVGPIARATTTRIVSATAWSASAWTASATTPIEARAVSAPTTGAARACLRQIAAGPAYPVGGQDEEYRDDPEPDSLWTEGRRSPDQPRRDIESPGQTDR